MVISRSGIRIIKLKKKKKKKEAVQGRCSGSSLVWIPVCRGTTEAMTDGFSASVDRVKDLQCLASF